MNQYIEKYGKQAISEVLDQILIAKKGFTDEQCLEFLVKHKFATNRLKYARCAFLSHTWLYRMDGKSNYGVQFYIYDRRDSTKFGINFLHDELNNLLEELQNETN